MLVKINAFLQSLNQPKSPEVHNEQSLRIACAVLLCEVMRADGQIADAEQEKIAQLLKKHFSLPPEEVAALINTANIYTEQATDFYQFTSKINQYYRIEERISIVELLWQVADADGEISSIEHHIIRKIADLLHLRHNEYIASKLNTIVRK